MASFVERLQFLVSLNADDAVKGFQKVGNEAEKGLKKAEQGLDRTAAQMTKFGAGAMAFAGVASVALFGMAKSSDEAALSQEKLLQTIDTMPQLAGASADAFTDLADAIQGKTAADGDAIVSGQALAGQMGLTQAQILELTPLAVDLARKMGVDMDTAFKTAAKAATGSEGALKKMGISVNEAAHEVDPFRATVDALGQSVGGFAEREGKTFTGSLQRMKNEVGDAAEAIGSGAIPVLSMFGDAVSAVTNGFTSLPAPIQKGVGGFAAFAVAATGAVGALSFAGGQIIKARQQILDFSSALSKVNPVVLGASAAIAAASALYLTYASAKQKATERTNEYAEALQKQASGNQSEIDQLAASKFATDRHAEAMERLGLTLSDVTKIVQGEAVPAWDEIQKATQHNTDIFNLNGETISDQTGVLRGFIAEVEREAGYVDAATRQLAEQAKEQARVAEATGATTDKISIQVEETSKLADGAGEAVRVSDELAGAMDGVAAMASNAADAIKDQQEALDDLRESTIDAEQAQRDLTREAWNVEDAVRAVNEKLAEGDLTSRDAKESMLDLKDAVAGYADKALDAAEKQATANGEAVTAEEKLRIQQEAAEDLRDMMPGLTGVIDDYVASLDAIEREIKTVITIEEIDNRRDRRNDGRNVADNYGGNATQDGAVSWTPGAEILTPIDPELDRLNKEAEKKAEEARRAAEAAERAAQDRLFLYDELKDAEEDQRDAARDTADAVAKLEEIRKNQPGNLAAIEEATDNANSALRDEIDAAVEAAEAQAALEGRTLTAAEMQSVMAGKLDELAGKFPSLIAQVREYADALGLAGLGGAPSGGSAAGGSTGDRLGGLGSGLGGSSLQAQLAKVKAEQEARIAAGQGASSDLFLMAQALAAQIAAQITARPVVLSVDGRELSTAQASASWGRVRAMGLG